MQQYFIKGNPQSTLVVTDKDTAKHMFSVMRLKEGDQVTLVFDDGVKRLAQVLDPSQQSLAILEELADNTELPVQVTIASGFPKGDKLEFITQKATELGACALWAFPADWSVAKWDGKKLAKKSEKLEKIAQGAAEQSKRNLIPEVKLFDKKADFLAQLGQFNTIVVAYEEAAKEGEAATLLQTVKGLAKGDKLLFIFGPEGGLSPDEIVAFRQAGAVSAGLGPRILRAETAPLYALSTVSVLTELIQ
ncbi:Ribosomal RNA small subunit methyltransferase E [Streptococcus intermedius]|uniref:16S rRNA (uracil(1498)-N(3))-methyltransferase n=1 Tax=Streptococcus intermedius TaxID=1338 RepID=UPI000F69007D|nr:16S rRNA (uracil(1498)-N(3))-methyltransferase [Streptococcus intermedius]RSJ10234.1 Ribosomal RNA small subunit methyltransferase E [Streptococcus intermedius]RSJ15822.1 Ribosomal RNA small subunit methyltransferase E [Streptococcus intermedius]RSJ29942.1 Ribosomal RNA small subunit methyltransferase E [Streptococcus intermedius]